MKSLLLFLFWLPSLLQGAALQINSLDESALSVSDLEMVVDHNDNFTADTVEKRGDWQAVTRSTLGIQRQPIWTRVHLTNHSDATLQLVLSNPRTGMDYIDVYLLAKDQPLQRLLLGDMRPMADRSYRHPASNFALELSPGESRTVITRLYSYGTVDIGWRIEGLHDFLSGSSNDFLLKGVIFGFIFALTIYNLIAYVAIGDRIYLTYATFLLITVLGQFSLQGVMYHLGSERLNLFFITYAAWFFSQAYMAYLYLLFIHFFNIQRGERAFLLFGTMFLFHSGVILYYTLSFFHHELLQDFSVVSRIALIEILVLVFYSIRAYRKGKRGSFPFMLGQIIYGLLTFYYIFTLQGAIETNLFSQNSFLIGLFTLSLFISYALSSRWKEMKEENRLLKVRGAEQQKFTLIGATIAYVSHQWQQPLAQLSALIVKLQAIAEQKPDQLDATMQQALPEMELMVANLSTTIGDVKRLFKESPHPNSSFSLSMVVEECINNFRNQYRQISFHVEADKTIALTGDSNLFSHTLGNILQNSVDQCSQLPDGDCRISVWVEREESSAVVTVQDNAGGITITPINTIFDNHISSKNRGFGLGLALAKNIVISKFHGTISATNEGDGARLVVTVPIQSSSR
ncbi:MAG: sensor histidine kinase [Gammaproteobacteria bacterium]|nr:sensor histidine kinase [Gammaproteobacteria bacterium]